MVSGEAQPKEALSIRTECRTGSEANAGVAQNVRGGFCGVGDTVDTEEQVKGTWRGKGDRFDLAQARCNDIASGGDAGQQRRERRLTLLQGRDSRALDKNRDTGS